MDTIHDTPKPMTKKKTMPAAENLPDTIKVQVGKNQSDIEHLKKQVGDLETIKMEMVQTKNEVSNLKFDLNKLEKLVIGQRKWLLTILLAIPGTLIAGLTYNHMAQNTFETTLEKKVQTSIKSADTRDSIVRLEMIMFKNDIKDMNTTMNEGFTAIRDILIQQNSK